MDVPAFPCDYLGLKTLNKPATSVAGLQAPIRDLYFHFRNGLQQSAPRARSTLRVTPSGMLVSVVESSGPVDMFFDIKSFNLVEAVRFAVINEKKHKALFLPLLTQDARGGSLNDKAAFVVDKPYQFLVQAGGHQPLLVCVLRRPKGVKAMDCHTIALDNPDTALHVLALIRHALNPGAGPPPVTGGVAPGGGVGTDFNRGGSRGDFIRTEFGDYNVYRGGGGQAVELRNEHFRSGDGGGGGGGGFPSPGSPPEPLSQNSRQPNLRETYPVDSSDRPRFGWTYDAAQPQGVDDGRRGPPGQYEQGRGGPPSSIPGLMPSGGGPVPSYPGDARYGGQYPPDGRSADGRYGNQYQADRRSGELKDGDERALYRGGGSYDAGNYPPAERRDVISHVRDRSGDSGDGRLGVGRSPGPELGGRRYDSGAGVYREARQYAPASPRSSAPPSALTDRPAGSIVSGAGGVSPRLSAHQPLSPRTSAAPYDGRAAPNSPSAATGPAGGPAFSLSNRESRGDVTDEKSGGGSEGGPPQAGKPVAKVPPHMKGVKVLPSDFLAVKLKPKAARAVSEDASHDYDNSANVTAQYKLLQQQEAHKSTAYSERWNDSDPRPASGSWSGPELKPGQPFRAYPGDDDRRYIEQFSDKNDAQLRHDQRYDVTGSSSATRHAAPGYLASDIHDSAWHDFRSQSGQSAPYPGAQPVSSRGGGASEEGQNGRKKEAEIASMFTNFRIQGRQEGRPDNFEDSLGYLP